MFDRSRIVTAIVTVGIAGAAAYFTQAAWEHPVAANPQVVAATQDDFQPLTVRPGRSMLHSTKHQVMPQPTSASLVLRVPAAPAGTQIDMAFPAKPLPRIAAVSDAIHTPPSDMELNYDGFGMTCGSDATAEAAPGGIVRLSLKAACDPGAVVVIKHDALTFKTDLTATGGAVVEFPALRTDASLLVTIGSNAPSELNLTVPEATLYDRVALVGPGVATMSIHAMEFGAGPGSVGHVSARRPPQPDEAGGTVLRLGNPELDDPLVAEIYSFPTGRDAREGTVRLSVAARVTDENCGSALRVRSIHATGGGVPARLADISVPMPDCRAAGRILVLKNLVEDLRIARN